MHIRVLSTHCLSPTANGNTHVVHVAVAVVACCGCVSVAQLIRDIVQVYKEHNLQTRVLSASIRHPTHAFESAKAGAYAGTMPFKVSRSGSTYSGSRSSTIRSSAAILNQPAVLRDRIM
jgi:hypothetical protein